MNSYIALNNQIFSSGELSIVPIRYEDRLAIMKWRNEQMYHLRQDNLLTVKDQDHYFNTVIKGIFSQKQPNQILFSYLENNECIGYGGLVHINWKDQNAELSFLIDTSIEQKHYEFYLSNFFKMIQVVAFKELNFHKLFTYTFDVRPEMYPILENQDFYREAVLKDHCSLNGEFKDVIIYSKLNTIKKPK
jgi:RimJ/RimL family protein N-acetyltransferase